MSAGDIEDIYELSPLQQGVLFHTLYDGGTDIYINQRTFMIDGPLDTDALLTAWQQATGDHPALRTTFHWDGLDKPLQLVHRTVPAVVYRHDWTGHTDQPERLEALLAADLAAGFDPATPPLQRLSLVRLGDNRHGLIWTHHLLLLDGWSVPIVMNDVVRRYQCLTVGGTEPLPSPPYRDYIAWLQQQDMAAARTFWTQTLGGAAEPTQLAPLRPADPRRPPGPVGDRIANLPASVEAGLRSLAARHGVTVNTVLQAAWALVLQHFSGDAAVTFGVTSSCRPPELPGVDRVVGLFTNSLPVRVPVPDDGDLGAWLKDIQSRYTAIRRYEYSPLAQIKQWIGATGDRQLFHSLLVFDNYSLAVVAGEVDQRLSIRGIEVVEKTTYPVVITVAPEPAFALRLYYHRERLTPEAAEDILACFETALGALADAERIAPVAAALEAALDAPEAAVRYADAERTLPDLIERQAAATPDAVAVLADDEVVTYRELLEGARRVAAALRATGVGPGDVVGVCADRSPAMVTCLIGTHLAGAAYLPLEPSLPSGRLTVMVRDARVATVLTHRAAEQMAHRPVSRTC